MSPYEVLADWAIKMAARIEQQDALLAESSSTCAPAVPGSRRAKNPKDGTRERWNTVRT